MGKIKYLLKNVGLLTISNFSTKILTFLLLPLYTSVLSTSDYGIYDLVNTSVSLLLPIVTLDIADSTIRFALDKKRDPSEVLNISIFVSGIGVIIVCVLTLINQCFHIVDAIFQYPLYFIALFTFSQTVNILSGFARGIDKVKESSIGGAIGSGLTIILNVVFLVFFKLGLPGYFLATILGLAVQTIYLYFSTKAFSYGFSLRNNNELLREMTAYSRPLIINNIAWWINNASDRYVVTYFCGISANGIYSVGYKIPTIINVLQSIFQQAWMLSAVKEYNEEDSRKFYSAVYTFYNLLLLSACSVIILFNKTLALFLYKNEFFSAWQYVPFLSLGFIFIGLANFLGGIFQAVKDSRIIATSTVVGAIVNIVLDLVLTPMIGPIGAAIATCFSYMIVWVTRIVSINRYMHLDVKYIRDSFAYIIICIQCIVNIWIMPSYEFVYHLIAFVLILLLYSNDMMKVGRIIKHRNR